MVTAANLPAPEIKNGSAVVLPTARQLDMHSKNTGHHYRIFIEVPALPPPEAGYPVLYVLDGNASFPVAAFLARNAASQKEKSGLIPPLIVGIGYPTPKDYDVDARQRDYTIKAQSAETPATEGGADRFLDFIEQELKPVVAAAYPVDRKRQALFGHSFGGLLVLHTLFTRPASFSTYLASSPSIWWKDKLILTEASELLAQEHHRPLPRVQISVGALEEPSHKHYASPEIQEKRVKRAMVSEARNLTALLKEHSNWASNVTYYELAEEDHGSAWLPAMTRGIRFFTEQP